MSIPKFNKMGVLDKGIYKCNTKEFIERFCYGKGKVRKKYKQVFEEMCAFAVRYCVKSIIVAGSFVTDKESPNDLDCIIIFPNEKAIPMKTNELLVVEDCELDIMFAAEDNRELIYSLLNMFSFNRCDFSVGMVEVVLDEECDKSTWDDYEDYNSIEKLLEAREAYIFRKVVRGVPKKKLLVTICNAKEYLVWNYQIAPIVSSSGWTFAPYIYTEDNIKDYMEHFNKWINAIFSTYETDISIFADGLGTYILGSYLSGEDLYKNAQFDKIILSKSLINSNFNWEKEFSTFNVNLVVNLIDNINTIKIKENIPKLIKKSDLYGESYKNGFNKKYDKLIEYRYKYTEGMNSNEFKERILPIYHIANMLVENNQNNLMENIGYINSQEIKLSDAIIGFNK